MAATSTPESKARITARVPASVQSVLEEAAACMGVPVNSFLVSAAVEKANKVLEAERIIHLTPRDAKFIAQLIENPSQPEAALLEAARAYREMIGE